MGDSEGSVDIPTGNGDISVTGNGGVVQGPKWEWIGSHDQRLKNMLVTGFQSDLTLVLGQEGLKVPVHRIFLQTGSQVLNGKIKESAKELIIDNVDTRIFKMLLQYFYTGKSEVEMIDALELMQLATEYEVSGLRDDCAAILKGDLSVENILPLFQSGMQYAHGDFIQCTLKFICDNATVVLKREEFANLRLECLIEIIQQDSLKVLKEMKVLEAVHRWGLAECKRKNLDPTNAENLRSCLAKPLNHIRFPLMDPAEFALNVTSKKLLNTDESMELLTCFLVPPKKRNLLPPGRFVSSPRHFISGETTVTRPITDDIRKIDNVENVNGTEAIVIRASESVLLKSISIPKEILQFEANLDYFYDLVQATLTICNGSDSQYNVGTEIDTTLDNIKICLKPPYQMDKQDGWTKIMLTLSGQIGYNNVTYDSYRREVKTRANSNLDEKLFPENQPSRVVTNYEGFTTRGDFLDVEIKRPEGEGIELAYGFIEELELEAV
ncbi:kelch-like protein 11 [Folsomia candida]|uniref:kelch-like protein 11 n=1 Tax=Folsomia candida TaxID=158441 RepID=UPI000B8F6114|nr:kelch-like protein 11 [Folsomia candida]XP_021962059.1 kelch-like protein 11 [Folsomia candida]